MLFSQWIHSWKNSYSVTVRSTVLSFTALSFARQPCGMGCSPLSKMLSTSSVPPFFWHLIFFPSRCRTFEVRCNPYFQQFPRTPSQLLSGKRHWNPSEMDSEMDSRQTGASETPCQKGLRLTPLGTRADGRVPTGHSHSHLPASMVQRGNVCLKLRQRFDCWEVPLEEGPRGTIFV